ncbi:MAG: PAS domain S-box protein [Novosphingobium sp.]|nr:PAS domain S-box protein [Novosphingobium sp.]
MTDAAALFDALPDPAFGLSSDGRVVLGNAAFAVLTGRKAAAPDCAFAELFAATDAAEIQALWQRLRLDNDEPSTARVHALRAEGTYGAFALRCRRIAGQGKVHALATLRPIAGDDPSSNRWASGHPLFQELAEHAPIGIYCADAKGGVTYVNSAWAEKVGMTTEECLGSGWQRALADPSDLVGPPRWQDFSVANSRRARINRFHDKSGHVIEIHTINQALFDPEGTLCGFVGAMIDISDQQELICALETSEARFGALTDLLPVAVFRTDGLGKVLFANPAWRDLVQARLEDVLGTGWARFIHPDDRERLISRWRERLGGGVAARDRLRIVRNDAEVRTIDVKLRPEFAPNGEFTGAVGVALDVTELLSARESSEQLALLATHSTDAIVCIDLDGVCRYASPAVQELLGVPAAALIGHQLLVSFHPEDDDAVKAALRSIAEGECEYLTIEWRSDWLRSPGEYYWIEGSCRLIRGPDGAPIEIVASLRNIDEHKRLETQLMDAREAAEQATRAQAMFIANMSHEIRTPMNGVIGATDLLLASELNPDQRHLAEMLAQSGETMVALLDDVLELSRHGSPSLELSREPLSIRDLVAEVANAHRPLLRDKSVELRVSIGAGVPRTIISDGMRLRQIVGNLIGNAVKFTAQGTIELRLSLVDRDRLRLDVADTGAGFDQARAKAIFEPFVQADEAVHRRFGGTGLGLAIVSEIVRTMQGSIAADGEPGRGATFSVELPFERGKGSRERTRGMVGATTLGRYSGRVLVAEDHPVNQAIIASMLDKFGLTHAIVEDGEKAVALLVQPEQAFDLVLMDFEMPVLDGAASAAAIRQLEGARGSLPIIALTAHAGEKVTNAMNNGNFQDFLAKPVTLGDLEAVLRRYLPECPPSARQ